MKKVYLDNAATTPQDPEVVEAMLPYFKEHFGNPSSIHAFGQKAKEGIDKARKIIAKKIKANPDEIIFTSGGTEANNLALKGIAHTQKAKGNHIITSQIEHHSVLNTARQLEKEGFKVTYLKVDKEGLVDPKELEKAITKETILVSVMAANNEIGTIEPTRELAKVARSHKIYFHTDAVQAFCKIPFDVGWGIDLASFSAHKIHGPKGIGALYIKRGTKIQPRQVGGHQEFEKRAGTENVPAIVGFGKAVEIYNVDELRKIAELRDKLIEGVINKIPKVKLNGPKEKRLPNIANFSFLGVEGEALLMELDSKGIACSTGSACAAPTLEPSHVLQAIGITAIVAHSSLRMSLGKENSEEDIDYVLEILPQAVKNLRKISPF